MGYYNRMISNLVPLVQTFAASTCDSKGTFFGLVSWDHYLNVQSVTINTPGAMPYTVCKIQNFSVDPAHLLGAHSPILLIALAILDDLLRVAALIAVGYIIYGGIQYVTSQGAPDATKKAQQTIINALIGVVVAIIAASIVAFIGNRLGGLSK